MTRQCKIIVRHDISIFFAPAIVIVKNLTNNLGKQAWSTIL